MSRAGRLTLLILAAVAARALTFGSPLVHVDETFYLTVADAMTHGALPYVDLWDRKPVGLFLLYLPAAVCGRIGGLPASLYAYQAMALAAAVATAWLAMRLAERAGWRAGALPAALLYLVWLDLGDGQGGQTPVFYNLLMAGAALLAVDAQDRRRGLLAVLLVGLAMQVKYTVMFEGAWFALWLLADDWRRRRSVGATIGYALSLAGAALLPTALAGAAYAALGHAGAYVQANFVSIFRRGSDLPGLRRVFLRDAAGILTPLALALAGWRVTGGRADTFLRAWLVVAVLAFAGFGGWYDHYTLPVMLPGSVCAAALLRPRSAWTAAALALLFVAGQVILASQRAHRGTAAEFRTLADRVGRGRGGLFVWSGPVLLYPATGRPAPTRYLFPSHLSFVREAGSLGVDQAAELSRIFDRRPAVVVMGPPLLEENPALRALVVERLRRGGYRAGEPVRLGSADLLVFKTVPSRPAAR